MLFDRRDIFILLALLVIGVALHFVALSYPREVIFDEVHFGKFVTAYCCTGERFFDIHPPHAKLLIAGAAWLGGYRGGFDFDHIGQPYGSVPIGAIRSVAAVTGTLFPLIIYILLRQLRVALPLAAVGGALVALDNALVIQTRLIALDGVLLIATFGSLSAYLAAQRSRGVLLIIWLIIAGALAGLAVGTKFTGLAAIAILGVLLIVDVFRRVTLPNTMQVVMRGLIIGLAAASVYLGGWALHFALLPQPGPGDAFHVPTRLLPPNQWRPVAFIAETAKLHKIMFDANYNLTATHPSASSWWSWPFMEVPVFYWTSGAAQIYFVGNPIVWWGGTILFAVTVLASVVQFGQRRRQPDIILWIPIVGFCIAMLPLIRVPRALFLYHYLTPLLFSLIAGLVWLERYHVHHRWPAIRLHQVALGIIGAALLGFIYISPLTFGISLGTTATGESRAAQTLFWVSP